MYVCRECGKSVSQINSLGEHIRYVHGKDDQHSCKCLQIPFVVEKLFPKGWKLEEGTQVLSVFKCEKCSDKFSGLESLKGT